MPEQRNRPYFRQMNNMNMRPAPQRTPPADMTRRQQPARLEPAFSQQSPEAPSPKDRPPEKKTAAAPELGAAAVRNVISSVFASEDSLLILLILYLLYKEKADMKLLLALAYIML